MYEQEMNKFREKIFKNVSEKISSGNLNIQQNEKNSNIPNMEQRLQLYKDNLEKKDRYNFDDENRWIKKMRDLGYEGELFLKYHTHIPKSH